LRSFGLQHYTLELAWCQCAGKGKSSASQLADQQLTGWAVLPEQLEVCRHADGSEWLLGAGAGQYLSEQSDA
jgi:hypothetical protein